MAETILDITRGCAECDQLRFASVLQCGITMRRWQGCGHYVLLLLLLLLLGIDIDAATLAADHRAGFVVNQNDNHRVVVVALIDSRMSSVARFHGKSIIASTGSRAKGAHS